MRILSEDDVEKLIDTTIAVELAHEAYRLHAQGHMSAPGRLDVRRSSPKSGALVLAGFAQGAQLVVKTNVHAYPECDPGTRLAGSALVVWSLETCTPEALISSSGFNNHRTAAGFAAASLRLAPPHAETLTVIGTGKIAPTSLAYLAASRPIKRAFIVGRRREAAAALATRVRAWPQLAGIDVLASDDPADAVREADIIAAVTTADQPVFPGRSVRPGALVILGGANRPDAREADDTLARRATVVVDHLTGSLDRAGDIKLALQSGALTNDQILGEIGALPDTFGGPTPPWDVMVFKSIGIAPQDLLLARWLIERAEQRGVGTDIDLRNGSIAHAGPRAIHNDLLAAAQEAS
jgi:ornithine cyclodeaminase